MSPAAAKPTGYSGTPLAKKLGFKAPMTVHTVDAPREYRGWLDGLDPGVDFSTKPPRLLAAAHVFVTRKADLARHAAAMRKVLDPARAVALPLGFVDVKVCAVSDVWSGLKLVIRKNERP